MNFCADIRTPKITHEVDPSTAASSAGLHVWGNPTLPPCFVSFEPVLKDMNAGRNQLTLFRYMVIIWKRFYLNQGKTGRKVMQKLLSP